MLISEADKLTLGQVLHIKVPHAVKVLLDVKGSYWFRNSWMTKYQAIMCENPRVHLDLIATLNPATLLPDCEEDPNHKCLPLMEEVFSSRPHLKDIPLDKYDLQLFTDGSSYMDDGKKVSGYAIVMTVNLSKLFYKDGLRTLICSKTTMIIFNSSSPLSTPNFDSKPLTSQEKIFMCNTSEIQQRFLRAYKMMLKFFGVKLVGEYEEDTKGTTVERAENFTERFDNLTINTHNNLRITRVLLSLGELGAEEYQAPLVKFLLKEILIKHRLPNMKISAMNFFVSAVRDVQKRQDQLYFAWLHYQPKEEFMWGRHEELERYKAPPSMVAPLLPDPLSEWTPVYSEKVEEMAVRRTRKVWRRRMFPVGK
uniref:Opioid growth factor receptor (OGFr) conserved domain-containing protein n=1 Tax=Leptobrachium leishanense TaxID=445787 RepID=A0A8C5QHP7_9ANUR